MKVAVRFFARYREAAGRDHVELELPEGGTVEAAWEAVASRFPVLQPYRPFTLFALGTDYVQPNHPLRPGEGVGGVESGEWSGMIGGGSPHRAEAFEACHFAIDTLKTTVPVWKKEYFEDGEVWVGLQGECSHGRP